MSTLDHRVEKIKKITALFLDVDGVFTDGRFYLDSKGREIKSFHTHDGAGLKQLSQVGIRLAIISGRRSPAVTHRMRELDIKYVYQGVSHKLDVYHSLLARCKLTDSQVAYMGDDLPDLPVMRQVGLSIAPANAVESVKQEADWITQQRGGHGAIREICDFILSIKHGRL